MEAAAVVPDAAAVTKLDAAAEKIRQEKARLSALQLEYTMKRDQYLAAEMIMRACKENLKQCVEFSKLEEEVLKGVVAEHTTVQNEILDHAIASELKANPDARPAAVEKKGGWFSGGSSRNSTPARGRPAGAAEQQGL